MSASEKMDAQKRGRPATGQGVPVQVRLQPDQLAKLDAWISANDEALSRPEAIRRIISEVTK